MFCILDILQLEGFVLGPFVLGHFVGVPRKQLEIMEFFFQMVAIRGNEG
jgi:hypothetical protein